MKKISELTEFYYRELHPILVQLEKKRTTIRFRLILVACALLLCDLIYLRYARVDFIMMLSINALIAFGMYRYLMRGYKDDFKDNVILPLIHHIDANLVYMKKSHIDQKSFEQSKIFTETPDGLSGNDYIYGKIDDIMIELSDVHAWKKERNAKNKITIKTLFKGLFIVSEFNKSFKGTTVVLPDVAQSSFGNLVGGWLQSHNLHREDLVKMDNVLFEQQFVVYGSDQIEARYILSHALMKRLLEFQERSKHRICVSFVNAKIYLAIEYNKDLFEPSVFRSLLEYKTALEYIATLHLAIGIVEELQLNEKLWSKA
ncbi:DUF3137 domain-containing protein [Sulfurospirillum sp. 1612]|uniref:DUF3137 domain-containing protein n=1 Tax=Sulfurospirillum sp. 1612 TaxID=3094835 RepID=UPI002F959F54